MHSIRISTCMFLLIASITACETSTELPSRQECIVKIAPGQDSDLDSIVPDPDALMKASHRLEIPVGGTAYSRDGYLYLQFSRQCNARRALAEELMFAIFGESAEKFEYKSDGIIPGPDTIDVMGDAWKEERGALFGFG